MLNDYTSCLIQEMDIFHVEENIFRDKNVKLISLLL